MLATIWILDADLLSGRLIRGRIDEHVRVIVVARGYRYDLHPGYKSSGEGANEPKGWLAETD